MSTPPPRQPGSASTTDTEPPWRSGRTFVILSLVFLGLLLVFLLMVSPRLQDRMGLNGALPFPTPVAGPQEVPLMIGDVRVGVATWDGGGVCAEVTDSAGTTFRTCAVADPLRPIWAIDAPDEAAEPYLLVATPPQVINIEGSTTDGESFAALVQARELPAAWALVRLPRGAVVADMVAFNSNNSDVGGAQCGVEDAPTGGPDRLAGGCLVPEED